MSDITDLGWSVVAKTDQLNAEALIAAPITITITAVRGGSAEQPLILDYAGDDGRPYKPCKTMRKALVIAWGKDGRQWVGRSMTLFCDHAVAFGGVKVGGIRISHLSHIERDLALMLTATKGKKAAHVIRVLDIADPRAELYESAKLGTAALRAAWTTHRAALGGGACPDELKQIAALADAAAITPATTET